MEIIKIKFYQTKGEFASSYINDRRFMMEEKVEELIDIYKQQIYSLCYKLAKTKEDAEDIFQETWIKVFHRGTNFLMWRIIKMDYYNLCSYVL